MRGAAGSHEQGLGPRVGAGLQVSMIVMLLLLMMLMMTQGVPGDGCLDPGAVGGQLRCAQDEEMSTERCNIVPTIDLQTIQRIIVLDRFSNDNLRSFLLNSMY